MTVGELIEFLRRFPEEDDLGSCVFDAIVAIEKKIGVDNSTDEQSFDYRINELEYKVLR